MKKAEKLLAILLSLTLMLSIGIVSAFAAEEYSYQVTLSAGTQGIFNDNTADISCIRDGSAITPEITRSSDGKRIILSGLHAGDQLSFSAPEDMITRNDDSKYYVSGVRMSGVDNNNIDGQRGSFTVSDDRDYVVAYGIQGEIVKGTIRYVTADGTSLLADRTFYGNVGDVRVVSYSYVDGYQPQAYNLRKTLLAEETENVFTFVYTPITTTTPTTNTNTAVTTPQTNPITPGTANDNAANNADANNDNNAAANNDNAADNGTNIADNTVPTTTPEDIVDLDENETPLASGTNTDSGEPTTDETTSEHSGSKLPVIIIIIIAVAGAGGGGYYFYRWRKK